MAVLKMKRIIVNGLLELAYLISASDVEKWILDIVRNSFETE
jgi:hypothetical protein